MYRNIARGFVAMAAGAALSAAGASGTVAPNTAAAAAQVVTAHSGGTSHGPTGPAPLWIARYDGPHNSDDGVSSMAVSPDGKTVFVTGTSEKALAGAGPGDFATVAYRAATGTQLWVARYNGPGDSFDQATSVAVSPDGATVFVTGYSDRVQGDRGDDYATIAYRADTGARLWVRRYNGPGTGSDDAAFSVAVSPDGGRVFVTGSSGGDYATVAYQAVTGTQLWDMRFNGPSNPRDGGGGIAVAVSPGGRTVFVTGTSSKPNSVSGYATIAYRAATGGQLWATRYNAPGNGSSRASSLAVSPDGSKVFVTGASDGDYATVGYSAATGGQLWAARYNGPGNLDDYARAVAVSPDGSKVFVTGDSWLDSPQNRTAPTEYVTIAYGAVTGARLWARHYHNGRADEAGAVSVAVSPAGLVFVTGTSQRRGGDNDYATIAYRG